MSDSELEQQIEDQSAGENQPEASADELRILEALLFASEELLTPARLKTLLPGEPDARRIRKMVDKINVQLQKERHPFEIAELAGGYQFRTVSFYHPWVRKLNKEKAAKKLSMQALECLAIIAYRQPISKAEVEAIRGVVSDGAMKTLLEKKVVNISGRSDKPGRPLLYSTTQEFLRYFGLNKIADLPRIEEFEALAREKMEELSLEELKSPGEQTPDGDSENSEIGEASGESEEQFSSEEHATHEPPDQESALQDDNQAVSGQESEIGEEQK